MNADPTDLSRQFIARGVPTHLWIANPDGRLEYCNSGWCDFAGRPSEDMLAEGWPGLIHPGDLREFLGDWHSARSARQVFEKECRLIAADGMARRFFVRAEPLLDGNGKVANWHGLNTALPEPGDAPAHESENAAETIARVRTRMTASANHDLRQPLTALSFLANSLAKRLRDPISQDLLSSMGRAIQSMRNVVDGQLFFDQVDSGQVEPQFVDHHINASLIGLAGEFNSMAERKGLGFMLHPSSACIRTDPALLDTILKNLVCNALRYTVEGRVVVGCRRQGEWLRIEIHDTGRGIAADELGLIWQDFFRSSRSVQEYPGGYGLGLVYRKAACQPAWAFGRSHHQAGAGLLLRGQGPALGPYVSVAQGAGNGQPLEGVRVLLLDTDPVTTNSVRLLVEEWGGTVETTASADQAAEQLGKADVPPHVVLADLRFGGAAGGIVTLRQLLARSEHPVRGIILVEENTPVREREIALAGYRMIAKPIAPEALFHALR